MKYLRDCRELIEMTFELNRDFGGIEINLKFTLNDLINDALNGGSARLNLWLEEQTTPQNFPELISSFRWNPKDSLQSAQTLLCMCNLIAQTDQSEEFFNENSHGIPPSIKTNVGEIIHLLQGGHGHSKKPAYEQLDLITLNLELLSIISEIQQTGVVSSEVVNYLEDLASVSREKNRHDDNYSMVDLYLNSRNFSYLFAQIDFLHDHEGNGRDNLLKFLKENMSLQIGAPVPYPNTEEGYQILMAFTTNPPNVSHIPFMEHVDVEIWHHIYSALDRRE